MAVSCPHTFLLGSHRSKHLLVFNTSSVQQFYVFQDVFKTFSRLLTRHLENVFKTSSRRLGRRKTVTLKTSSRRLEDMSEDILKTSLEDVLKTYLEDVFKTFRKQRKFLLVMSVSNKSLFHKLYLRNLRQIQNASLRTQ